MSNRGKVKFSVGKGNSKAKPKTFTKSAGGPAAKNKATTFEDKKRKKPEKEEEFYEDDQQDFNDDYLDEDDGVVDDEYPEAEMEVEAAPVKQAKNNKDQKHNNKQGAKPNQGQTFQKKGPGASFQKKGPNFEPSQKKQKVQERLTKREQRKQAKPENFDRLFKEKLSVMKKEDAAKLVEEEMKIFRGKMKEFCFHNLLASASRRNFELILKYGSDKHREEVYKELKGTFLELIVKYIHGDKLAKKLLKYCKKDRMALISELKGQLRTLLLHKHGSEILDYVFSDLLSPKQKHSMMMEFYSKEFALFETADPLPFDEWIKVNAAKKDIVLKNLFELLEGIFSKGPPNVRNPIVHTLLLQSLTHASPDLVQNLIAVVKDQLIEIVHTKDGACAAIICVTNATAKDRKDILKSTKGYVDKILLEEHGHHLLLRLLDVTDDIKLLEKKVFKPVFTSPQVKSAVLNSEHGLATFLWIFAHHSQLYFSRGKQNPFFPLYDKPALNSKKDPETRYKELQALVYAPLAKYAEENMKQLLSLNHGAGLVYELITKGAKKERTTLVNKILELTGEGKEDNILSGYFSSRMLKRLVKDQTEDPCFAQLLFDTVDNKHVWATQKGSSFVILSLLESPITKAQVKKELKLYAPELQSITEKGTELIVKILKE